MVANLLGGLVFGIIGLAAFRYGKREANIRLMLIGGALMVYPYFVSNTPAMIGIGVALTAAIFFFRD